MVYLDAILSCNAEQRACQKRKKISEDFISPTALAESSDLDKQSRESMSKLRHVAYWVLDIRSAQTLHLAAEILSEKSICAMTGLKPTSMYD